MALAPWVRALYLSCERDISWGQMHAERRDALRDQLNRFAHQQREDAIEFRGLIATDPELLQGVPALLRQVSNQRTPWTHPRAPVRTHAPTHAPARTAPPASTCDTHTHPRPPNSVEWGNRLENGGAPGGHPPAAGARRPRAVFDAAPGGFSGARDRRGSPEQGLDLCL